MMFSSTEFREELIPGTELLLNTDLNSTRSGDAELVLVPEPSNQPDDPLVRRISYLYFDDWLANEVDLL